MTTAELQAVARRIVADLVAKGQIGELDANLHAALADGLARRGLANRIAYGTRNAPRGRTSDDGDVGA